MSKSKEMIILKRVGTREYIEIDTENFKSEKPIILVLGGNGTNDNSSAKGNANIVSSLLGVFNEDVDLLTVNYNGLPAMKDKIQPILNLFKPLISEKGERLELNEALKNMRKVNIFAHCYGCFAILEETLWQLTYLIQDLGYSDDEETLIMQQIVAVTFASKRPAPFVCSVDMLSLTDCVFDKERRNVAREFLKNLDNVKLNPKDKPYLKSLPIEYSKRLEVTDFLTINDRCYVMPTKDGKRLSLIACEFDKDTVGDHSINQLRRGTDWDTLDFTTPTGDIVSKCIGAVLCNLIANSMLNAKSDSHIPFDMGELREQLELIVQKINETDADYTI